LRGDLLVEPMTGSAAEVFAPGRRFFVQGGSDHASRGAELRTLHVSAVAMQQKYLRVSFVEVTDRTAAEGWRNAYLLLPVEETPPPQESETLLRDLPGLMVQNVDGESIGEVTDYYELPQGILLEVTRAKGTVLIPYREGIVRSVDVARRVMVVDPPSGLLD
jgi:16S rRNA processing protein RimM